MLPTSSHTRLTSATASGGSQELAKGVSTSAGSASQDQGKEEHETSGSTEYWTCSACSCSSSGSFHTCPECQDLKALFTHDDTRPPSEFDLPLDEVLRRSRSRSRSRSGSTPRNQEDAKAKSDSRRRSRSRSLSGDRYFGLSPPSPVTGLDQPDQGTPITVHVETRQQQKADQTPTAQAGVEGRWREVSSEKTTTKLTLHSGDGSSDRTLTLEHTTSVKKPDEHTHQLFREGMRQHEGAASAASPPLPPPPAPPLEPTPPPPAAFATDSSPEFLVSSPSIQPDSSTSPEKTGGEEEELVRKYPSEEYLRKGPEPDLGYHSPMLIGQERPPFPPDIGDDDELMRKMRKSAEWLELRVVELTPGLVHIGTNLEEATLLQEAHEEVLNKLQSKQSPVEELLNQADQLISTQRPRAEVYAAMAESLGLAWKDLNNQLEMRKMLLDMSVSFHTRARDYSDRMDAAEKVYTDNVLPNDAESVRRLLSTLHDHKRGVLEASMFTLQEAQALLGRLRSMVAEGATMDSRPQHIRTNIEFACSQIEHYLESLHDRRRFLDGLFLARKHHLDQCLALCLLYQDLAEAVTALKNLRDEVSQHRGLGDSQAGAEILLHEHNRREAAAKEAQDRCVRHLRTAEHLASSGHYAGTEAKARAYSVLEAATALHETCDTRTSLLQQAILFFRLAQTALTKLDQAEVQVAGLGGDRNQRLSMVMGVVEEAVQPALHEGYAILEVTGGKNQPHNEGISRMVDELESRRSKLSDACAESTELEMQRTELMNAFLEQYNTIESWLVRIGDAFLQGHQDPGGSLSLAKDFLHLHVTLNHDVMEKKREIEALEEMLSNLLPELQSEEEAAGCRSKAQALREHWMTLKDLLDNRIKLSEKYVRFHQDAETVVNELEALEVMLKDAKDEDKGPAIDAKWQEVQKLYLDLTTFGNAFIQEAKNSSDPYLDVNRAVLCVQTVLDNLGKRRLVITDLHSHFQMRITSTKEMRTLWNTYRENVKKMSREMSSLETDFCPLLRGDPSDPEGLASVLEQRLGIYVSAVKKAQEDIQNMMTRAEVMSYKGSEEQGHRDEVISSLLQLYQSLQNKATEYQILGHMLIQWCRNIVEIHRTCNKLESQFDAVALDIGGVEGQLREHEASRQAVLELLKFAQNEADAIIRKIKEQCPPEVGAQDIAKIEEMLRRRRKVFEEVWSERQLILERQIKRSQYHVDLQVISDQLRELSDQLGRMKGHYGDSLNAALNMASAFNQFEVTVDMLEKRIQTFVTTAVKMLTADDDSGEIQDELGELQKKWSTFHIQVGQTKKSIELSIEFFKLVDEAEGWFKEGSKLLVAVAGESSNIQSPEEAQKLRSRIEVFLKPGEEKQANRIRQISNLAIQLYGDTAPQQVEVVSQQNRYMLDSFGVINKNLNAMAENLRTAEEHREKQKKENEELAASLAAAQAEAEVARLAAAAAEEARKAAEEVAKAVVVPVEPEMPVKVEVDIQTEAIPLPPEEEESPPREEPPPTKKTKLIDDEIRPMPPVFITPLVGATVTEGVKFSFECRVMGFPMPEVEWLKDGMSISGNPDYKTEFEEGICTLTIEETFTEDSATFTCRAVNGAGIAETSANLVIKEAEQVEVMAPPVFTKRLVDSSTKEGSSFQLEATVSGHPLPVVSWSKNGTCVDESPDYVITYNNGDCVLRFEEVYLEDQAEYMCRATNELGEDVTKAHLTVTAVEVSERPQFSVPLSNVMARAGQKFKLECHVTGLPTPTLAWFHNGKPVKETPDCRISFDGKVATLIMSEAFPKNAGTYSAVAKNTAGEAQCSANVSVKGRIPTETSDSEMASDLDVEPVKPSIQLALKDTTVKEGASTRLDCVIVGQPEPEVIWYHDDKPVKESSDFKLLFHGDRCSLLIQEAFLEDAGMYRVVAVNSAGEASTACFLNIEPAPELTPAPEPLAVAPRFTHLFADGHVTEGEPVTLRACITGTPTPTVAWFRDGVPLLPDAKVQINETPDGVLTVHIPRSELDHTGQYEVVASNSAGSAKCIGFLSIEQRLPTPPPPEPTEPPAFTTLISDITATKNQSARFEAVVTGKPTPTVHWTTNDRRITGQEYHQGVRLYVVKVEGNKNVLEIPVASNLHEGRVAVVAENVAGRATSAAHLWIEDPPSALPREEAETQTPLRQLQDSATEMYSPGATTSVSTSTSTYTSSTSMSSMMQKTSKMESTFITKVITSDGDRSEAQHSMSAASASQVKKASGEPTVEVHSSRLHEFRQEGDAPPSVADRVSLLKREGDQVTEEVSDTSVTSAAPKKIPAFATKMMKKTTPARFLSPLQGVIAKEGDRVFFECNMDGHPEPTVTWSHNGAPLKGDVQTTVDHTRIFLVIPRVNQAHAGRYTCAIANEAGSAQCTADLVVKKTQFPPVFGKRLQPAVVGIGERIHLEVDVTGTPQPQVTWSKGGMPLVSSDRVVIKSEGTRHWLVIQHAALPDTGRYSVIADNAAGRAESLADVMVTQLIMEKAPPSTHVLFSDITDESKMFTTRFEERHEERKSTSSSTGKDEGGKPEARQKPFEPSQPTFEEFRRETKGHPDGGPFSEDTFYAKRDESETVTDDGRSRMKVEVQSETHVQVMSDKKVEVHESTTVDLQPKHVKESIKKEMPKKEPIKKEDAKMPKTTKVEETSTTKMEEKKMARKIEEKMSSTKFEEFKSEVSEEGSPKQHSKPGVTERPGIDSTTMPVPKFEKKTIVKEEVSVKTGGIQAVQQPPLLSTGLVRQEVTRQEMEKEADLKPFPSEVGSEIPKKPKGPPPPQPKKFPKGDIRESDYDSDHEGRVSSKWKPPDSDIDEPAYTKVNPPSFSSSPLGSKERERISTSSTKFDIPPKYDGHPRPKIDFPESEPEPEREISPEIIIPEKIEIVDEPLPEPKKIIPKEPKQFKSQPPPKKQPTPGRDPSPVLEPGPPPDEGYVEPPPKGSSPFGNAVGVESTKITKIVDSSKYHKRFVSMQQTTRLIKFDSKTGTTEEKTSTPEVKKTPKKEPVFIEKEKFPQLEPFPFEPEPEKPKKERGQPPSKPKKFQKGEFRDSDYDSDYDVRIKPRWHPIESDGDELSYTKVAPPTKGKSEPRKKDRTPTPPSIFDNPPPPSGGPLRVTVEFPARPPPREPSPDLAVQETIPDVQLTPKKAVVQRPKSPPLREASPSLPPPGTPPEEGVIVEETKYVVDKVDLKTKVAPPQTKTLQTYKEKPYTEIIETTEKTVVDKSLREEINIEKKKLEKKTTVVTEVEEIPVYTSKKEELSQVKTSEIVQDLEPFPYAPAPEKPRREKGPPPPKPKKFVKGEFTESDFESDYEGKIKPKWRPTDSDMEDPAYDKVEPPPSSTTRRTLSHERTPTPPTKFEVPPKAGGPLRPSVEPAEKQITITVRDTSPEIVIPKLQEAIRKATPTRVTPKAPTQKPAEKPAPRPKEPTPPLPEPGPPPEVGYAKARKIQSREEEKEDFHIRMIKKKVSQKQGIEIDIDITDIYDMVSESDADKTDGDVGKVRPFPKLEPFPYEPEPEKPQRQKGPPPPKPKKFQKGEFRESDYESDYERRLRPKWFPTESEGEELVYRKVAPPSAGEIGKQRSESSGRDPSPPSKFDQPPHFEGPPRPVLEASGLPRRERRESLEEYSIPKFPKVEFKPFNLEDDVVVQQTRGALTTDTETEPETQYFKPQLPSEKARLATQKHVGEQFEDMTQTFRTKAQKFAEQLVCEVFAGREGSVPAEPAGEPPALPEELKTLSAEPPEEKHPGVPPAGVKENGDLMSEPQAYRDENRVSEFGTKHIDPDTGLIYFKYDFGYEFGIILPGEGKKVEKKRKSSKTDPDSSIPIPVIHIKSGTDQSGDEMPVKKAKTAKGDKEGGQQAPDPLSQQQQQQELQTQDTAETEGRLAEDSVAQEAPGPEVSAPEAPETQPSLSSIQPDGDANQISPQPSVHSDISETDREYQQYMGKVIPEFVPKKYAQFRPISGDPCSDSEVESEAAASVKSPPELPKSSPAISTGPKRFVPVVPGAAVQPVVAPGVPAPVPPHVGPSHPRTSPLVAPPVDPLVSTSALGASAGRGRGVGGRGRAA